MEDFCIVKYGNRIVRNHFFDNLSEQFEDNYDYKIESRLNYFYLHIYNKKKYSWYFDLELLNPSISVIPEVSAELAKQLNMYLALGISFSNLNPDLLEGIDYAILRR